MKEMNVVEGDECGWSKWLWIKEMRRRVWMDEMCMDEGDDSEEIYECEDIYIEKEILWVRRFAIRLKNNLWFIFVVTKEHKFITYKLMLT